MQDVQGGPVGLVGVEVTYYQCGGGGLNVQIQECLEACVVMGVVVNINDVPLTIVVDYIKYLYAWV